MQKLLYLIMMLLFLSFNISSQTKTVVIDQVNSSQIQIGTLQKWSGTQWSNSFIPGTSFSFQIGSTQTILGDQNIYSNQKYNNWNESTNNVVNFQSFEISAFTDDLTSHFEETHTGIIIRNSLEGTSLSFDNNIDVKFKDPWYIDYPDPLHANKPRNRGMSGAIFHDFTNSFSPTGDYKGVFLNQSGPEDDWEGTYYTVGSPEEWYTSTVHGESRSFLFGKWSSSLDGNDDSTAQFLNNGAHQSGVVFRDENAVVSANIKGEMMSNSPDAISSNSQRKFVRRSAGDTFLIYESMNSVWLEAMVDDDLNTYFLADNATNPSIDYYSNNIYFTYEKLENSVVSVDVRKKDNILYSDIRYTIDLNCSSSFYGSVKPVISTSEQGILVVYKPSEQSNLHFLYLSHNMQLLESGEISLIFDTDNAVNWSITSQRTEDFNVAVQINYNEVWYFHIDNTNSSGLRFCSERKLNEGLGGYYNYNPSISFYRLPNNDSRVLVTWTGTRSDGIAKLKKENVPYSRSVFARVGYAGTEWSPSYSQFGTSVDNSNVNSLNSSTGSVICFSQNDGQEARYVVKLPDGSYSPVHSLSHDGIQPMVCNGSTYSQMKAVVYDISTSAPYLMHECLNDFTPRQINKSSSENELNISYGRTGSLVKEGVEFIFNIGDVEVDNEIIRFIEAPDTLPINTISDLNDALKSNTFQLNSQSEILFSNYYYVLNHEEAPSILSDDFVINASIRLINASTNEVTGIFDPVQYTSQNTDMHNYRGYEIDCSGIEPGEYYMELHLSCDESMNYYLGRIQREEVLLAKGSLIKKSFTGGEIPVTCRLEQNYPNPFNPVTTISYYMPETGKVTLKIYDILGAEVATLKNGFQDEGRHSVTFNGAGLASGVYIYKLDVGDTFSETKKLVLLK